MDKPSFVCGAYTVTPEHPSDWNVKPILGMSEKTSLLGDHLRDVSWRKKQFVLVWEAMSYTDYVNLEELMNYHYMNGVDITFTYAKWPETTAGLAVVGLMSDRKRTLGSGPSGYYSNVTITLTEKAKAE